MASENDFTKEDFDRALEQLDKEVSESRNLRKVLPIKILAVGGYVSVVYLRNRNSIEDIDYILDPEVENQAKVAEKLKSAIQKVAKSKGYDNEWINSKVQGFTKDGTLPQLFGESIAQNIVLWQGKSLSIYAVKWEWQLARKLKRIGSGYRPVDVSDAAAIVRLMVQARGASVTRDMLKDLNKLVYTPIEDFVLDMVTTEFEAVYKFRGII